MTGRRCSVVPQAAARDRPARPFQCGRGGGRHDSQGLSRRVPARGPVLRASCRLSGPADVGGAWSTPVADRAGPRPKLAGLSAARRRAGCGISPELSIAPVSCAGGYSRITVCPGRAGGRKLQWSGPAQWLPSMSPELSVAPAVFCRLPEPPASVLGAGRECPAAGRRAEAGQSRFSAREATLDRRGTTSLRGTKAVHFGGWLWR